MRRVCEIGILIVLCLFIPLSPCPAEAQKQGSASLLSPATLQKAKDALMNSIVIVHIYCKKLPEDKPSELRSDKSIYKEFAERNTSLDLVGFVIDDEKNCIVLDPCFDLRHVDKVELTLPVSGKTIQGEISAIMLNAPTLLVRPKVLAEADELKPLEFIKPIEEPPLNQSFLAVSAYRKLQKIMLNASLVSPGLGPLEQEKPKLFIYCPINFYGLFTGYYHSMVGQLFSLAVILNNEIQPIGIATHSFLAWDESSAPWKGDSLQNTERVSLSEYYTSLEKFKKAFEPALYKVKIEFRQKTEEEEEGGVFSSFYSMFGYGGEKIEDLEAYGLAINDTTLLVPKFLDRKKAAIVKAITVTFPDGSESEGDFLGTYKDFAAILIRLKEDKRFPQDVRELMTFESVRPYQMYYSLHAEKKFGKKDVVCNHFRCYERSKIDENKYRWNLYGEIKEGDFVLNPDGKLVGLFIKTREKDEEIKQYVGARKSYYEKYFGGDEWFAPKGEEDLLAFADIKDAILHPDQYIDPRIKPLTKEEAKQKVWLGVEYSPINKELAKNLDVEKPTKDGEIGILISQVYPNSPAEKIGLKSGDIILSVRKKGERYPIELQPPEDEFREYDFGREEIPKAFEAFGFKMPEKKPWRSRKNYFTGLLDTIGAGEEIEITYYTEGQTITRSVIIQPAPADFDSAKKFKDEDIGLTLKDLTYEVRSALKIPADQSGVVVAKVETGTPASVAGIKQYEILTALDNQPLTDVDDFKAKIKSAQDTGKEKVSLRILSMGKSRVVDLKLPKKKSD